MRCSCEPPMNPLYYAAADPGTLWVCPLCDQLWRAVVIENNDRVTDNTHWARIPARHRAYYLNQEDTP